MKVLYLFFVLCILSICAQRRPAKSNAADVEASSQRPVSRGRGRARFSITPEFEQVSAEYEEVTKHTRKSDVPRRKIENVKSTEKRLPRPVKETGPKSRPYEVKEVVDDIPREDSRRIKKPRVVTESRFEAANAPKNLFTPASSTSDELVPDLSSFVTPALPESVAEETALPAQITTLPINAIPSTEKSIDTNSKSLEPSDVSSEIPKVDTELKRKQVEHPALSSQSSESRRPSQGRASLRTRGNVPPRNEEQSIPAPRVRTRTKPLRKSEESAHPATSAPSTRSAFRPARRRGEAVAESSHEPVKARGPSVFAAESAQELPSRSRTGRKVSSASERKTDQRSVSDENRSTVRSRSRINTTPTTTTISAPEKVDLNLNRRTDTRRTTNAPEKVELSLSRRPEVRRGNRFVEPSTEGSVTNRARNTKETETRPQRRGTSRAAPHVNVESTTYQAEKQSRSRVRSRSFLTLNEQKLEVLPLFESESKTVPQSYDTATVASRSSLGRRRSLNSADDIATASTKQSEVKLEVDPLNEDAQTSTQTNIRVSRQQSISVDSKTEKAIRKVYKKRPTFQRNKPTRKPHAALLENQVKESEVTEATRKFRPLHARKNNVEVTVQEETSTEENKQSKQTVKVDEPKVSFRQVVRKVSQKVTPKGTEKSTELTTSQEAIGDTDNYPASFKAAIQAKKNKKEVLGSRSSQSNELSVTKTTQKTVTSSSASTTLESSASSEATVADNIVNEDEEIDRKSETESTTVIPSTKFPRPRFSLTTKKPRSTEKQRSTEKPSESTSKSAPIRPVLPSRKYKPGRPKAAVTTTTPSSPDEKDSSSTVTPTPLQKFHARFKSARSQKDKGTEVHITPRTASKNRSYSPKAPKGLYSSRKFSRSSTTAPEASTETEKPKLPKFSVETSALSTKVPPIGQGIKKASRFSSRYRSDILSRSAHRTSTTGPQYIPTVPTVTPPPTSVKVEENELGMEIISFDDPIANTVPSANLISGDYLSSSPDPTSVESKGAAAHTTEKPVSIIERIINSITSISTTTSPDGMTKTSSTTGGQSTKSSAILSLVSKKPKDTTVTIDLPLESGSQKLTISPNSVAYRTTEKPTTVIEKILSSLSAIRADTAQEPTTTTDPLQVGSNYNTVDSNLKFSPTESSSRVAKSTIPMSKGTLADALPLLSQSTAAPLISTAYSSSTDGSTTHDSDTNSDFSTISIHTSSITPRSISITTPLSSRTSTTLDPTNAYEEIISDQTLPKRTIDKLLSLLNIVTSTTTTPHPTTTQLVIVTPKLTTFVTSNTEPINTELNATPVPTTSPTISDSSTTTVSSSSEATTSMLFTSTLKPSDVFSNEINSFVNPLATAEPTISSRLFEMISRIMGTTMIDTTTVSPTSTFTTQGGSTASTITPRTLDISTAINSESSVTTGTPTSLPSGTSSTSTTFTSSGTTVPVTATGTTVVTTPSATGAPSVVTTGTASAAASTATTGIPTSTGIPVASTIPVTTDSPTFITTPAIAANALAIPVSTETSVAFTSPVPTTDSLISTVTTQTNTPSSILTTSQPSTGPYSGTNPTTISSSTTGTSTALPTTIQGTTSTEVSVVQGPISTTQSTNPTTQTSSTLLTTANTTPAFTSTTGSGLTLTTTRPLTEVISASTGTTGSSTITSTTKITSETTTDSTLGAPSTLPTLANFEVSPDRVSVFSANDISSTFVPDDPGSTTVGISARAFVPGPTLSSSVETTTSNTVSTTQNTMPTSQPTVGTTGLSTTMTATTPQTIVGSTSTVIPSTASPTTNIVSSSVTTAIPLTNSGSTAIPSTSSPVMTTANTASTAVDATTQDVSSNTIDTSSVTDKQSLVNQSVSNLVNPLSAGTNVSVADNSSMSSGTLVSPTLPDNSTITTNRTMMTLVELMSRNGKLLQFEPNALQNDIQGSSLRDKDYFIFAVLPNNTILRKRPSMYPNRETPFLVYGVLPNNTLIQKFPNGTIVPMEPVIQVIGFDTRENPPPPPDIISNQVTPAQESRPDNNIVSTVTQNTVPQPNELSVTGGSTSTNAPSTLPPLTEILGKNTVTAFNTIVNQTNADSQTQKVQTLDVDPLIQSKINPESVEINTISSASSAPPPPPVPPSPSTTQAPVTPAPTSTTPAPVLTTTPAPAATTQPPSPTTTLKPYPPTVPPGPPTTIPPFTSPLPAVTTQLPLSTNRVTTGSPTTVMLPSTNPPGPPSTTAIPSTTYFPTFLTTMQPQVSTTVPSTAAPTTIQSPPAITSTLAPVTTTEAIPFTSPLSRALNPNPLSAIPDVEVNNLPSSTPTLLDLLSRGGISSSTPLPTTVISTTVASLQNINLKQKQLTQQQKQDIATLEALEKEQEAILQQLAFLTGLNLPAISPPKENDNLADRVIAMAMNRLKGPASTNIPPEFNLLETLSPKDSRQSKSIAAAPSVEELVKQISANGLNSVTPPGPIVTSTYGKSNEALLASLLKEYGVGPSTPKTLSGAFAKQVTTTSAPKASTTKRRATTQAPGRLMQGLNWLLNTLAPKPTSKPKPKPYPKAAAKDEELLSKQPTEITPVIVEAPISDQPAEESKTENNVISQKQLMTLIQQLEEIQKDPKKAKNLDIEILNSIRGIESNEKLGGIQVISASSTGATSRSFVTTNTPIVTSSKSIVIDNEVKPSATPLPLSIGSNIEIGVSKLSSTIPPVGLKEVPGVAEDLEAATTKSKIPPVQLNPVPGVPDGNPKIQGQLVNYAINVTKAISSFLGSALQGAANSFQSIIGSGSRKAGNYRNSDSSNRPG